MAILAECPMCHRKQAVKNKVCKCGRDLDRAKRSDKVRYWVSYRLPDGKQKREAVGFSIEDARDAQGKRRSQKRELGERFFQVFREDKITFSELSEWYLNLQSVRQLPSYERYSNALKRFNEVMGDTLVRDIKPIDLENYQAVRIAQGIAPMTAEIEVSVAHFAVKKADDNDMVDPYALKAFRRRKKALRRGENARDRVLSTDEYIRLRNESASHLQAILAIAMNTGMRTGEIIGLRWSQIDRKKWMIRLPAELTKEKRAKSIPVNKTVRELLESLPRALHHNYVITYRGQPVTDFHIAFSGACERAKIPRGEKVSGGLTFHDIRRTVKTNMARAGVDKVYRDTILGHSLKGMDAYYMKPTDDDLHAAMEKYSAWLNSEMANVDQTVDQAGTSQKDV